MDNPGAPRTLLVSHLGLVDYQEAWELQGRLVRARREGLVPDMLLLLQHPPTYTLGRRGSHDNILLGSEELRERGIRIYDVDRGGDVTYHGPGQLVGYPILKLPHGRRQDFAWYIRSLERAILLAAEDLGVRAHLIEHYSGVWVGDEKICAIGVKVDAAGITSHGFALNVNTDLSCFGHIIPCGIKDKGVTSLRRVLGRRVSMRRVEATVTHRIAEAFDLSPLSRRVGRDRLEARAALAA